jgi:hypothetical protein
MSNQENKKKDDKGKAKIAEETDKSNISEKERYKGKLDKATNKARATAGKARRKSQGHEAVSDQKSHEYH